MAAIDRDLVEVGREVDVAVGGGTARATGAEFPLYDTQKTRPRS
jgi:glycine cleavage system aminomethyltransferase T